jgi:hemerythrin-like domain-containing protein
MENTTILDIMVAQHGLIEVLFQAFKDEFKENSESAKKFLSEFSWEIKKHFFIEDQAIFAILPWKDHEISEMAQGLKKEHITMLIKLEKMLENLSNESEEEMQEFLKLMTSHREKEEQKLYPLLDEKLPEVEKNLIISRINEIPVSK